MKFLIVFVVATALGLLSIPNVAGQDQECDDEAYAILVDSFLASQSFLECTFDLTNYTFGNQKEYAALAAIVTYNQSGFDAIDQGNCSALNASLIGVTSASLYFGFTLANDSTAIRSGLYDAFLECVLPNETCDINYLTAALTMDQYGIGCFLTLADGSYQLSDDLEEILAVLDALNKTATYASIANQCDTLNTSFFQLALTLSRAAELIYNGSDTNVSDALTMCLFPEPTCSVNGTLITIQTELSCIISLNSSFVLNDSLVEIVNELVYQNWTAFNASDDNDCDTLDNATATILELIQNFTDAAANDTALACALNSCLYGNVTCNETCSIEDLNATLDRYEPVLDCLCELEYLFNLTDPESEKLDDADIAYVQACLAVDGEDNCTAVSEDVQLFVDTIQEFIDYAIGNNESSAEYVNAVNECANLSSTSE